jgi:high-affinity iron transporter
VRSAALALVVLAASIGAPATATARAPSPAETAEAEQIVFLLQYVGGDYAAAVRDGRVVDEAEYRENREFASMVAERLSRVRAAIDPSQAAELEGAARTLVRLVDSRADPRAVRQVTESAIPRLIEAFGLRAFPRSRPDPRRAAALFSENCATCHGRRGEGDGPRAKELDPPPARFSDPARLDSTAPYVFYNAITLGVGDTAMASFADSLSDQERWDLAFFVWRFRVPPPSDRAPPVRLSLRDLATRSSADLAPEVTRQAAARGRSIDGEEAARWIARLRADPPPLSDAEERLARLRQDLASVMDLVRDGKADAAADRVTTAYLTEFEPLEREIDVRDRAVRQRFERGLVDLRAALRRDDRGRALDVARDLVATVDQADDLLSAAPPRRSWRWIAGLALFAALAAAAIVVRTRGLERRAP